MQKFICTCRTLCIILIKTGEYYEEIRPNWKDLWKFTCT